MANDLLSLFERFSRPSSQNVISEASSTALLALGRFVRGAFQQVSLAAIALLLIMHLSGHAEESSVQVNYVDSQPSAQELTRSNGQTSLLQASLTHHHLTSARLSLPPLPPNNHHQALIPE